MHVLYPGPTGIWRCWAEFVKGGKPENPEKNPRSKYDSKQQTQPTYGPGRNRTRATLVGGQRSHHYVMPAPGVFEYVICEQVSW